MVFSDVIREVSNKLPLFESVADRDRFLKELVHRIKAVAVAEMAAIFLYDDENGKPVFRAGVDIEGIWDRLNCPECIEKDVPMRFVLDDNHVGRAFRDGEVIRLSFPPGDSEHPFCSELLIPVARGPVRIGVLILADSRENSFAQLDDEEILGAISRLGDLLDDASVLIDHRKTVQESRTIYGHKAGNGVAIGTAFPFWTDMDAVIDAVKPTGSISEEKVRFEAALQRSIDQLEDISKKAESGVSETGAMIFTAQILMLRDEAFTGAMRRLIDENTPAVTAIRSVVNNYVELFSKLTEQRFAEKGQDVRDLGYRMLNNLNQEGQADFSYQGRITLVKHIYPSDLFRLSMEGVSGVVLMGASVTAHISILAQSLDLPVLITDDKSVLDIAEGTPLIVDAERSRLLVNPQESVVEEYNRKISTSQPSLAAYTLKGRTADGIEVQVLANINILKDAEEARKQGAEGIGLYRSEFPFILKNDILSEEQQYHIYRSVVNTQKGKPVVFRTADIGGDKILHGRENQESNPFLGVRGIRFSLAHREMFRDQLRAILRAGSTTDLRIMLPMVSGVEEVLEAKEELGRAIADLRRRRVHFNENPRIGAMVELPSAALAVEELVAETDFLSIGTNDLTMYLLAVDRTNENLSHLYRNRHPTVLRTLANIARDSGDAVGKISVCGDAAADPVLTPFFLGIGIRKLSVPPLIVEPLKRRLAKISVNEAETIATEMLAISRVAAMEKYLEAFPHKYDRLTESTSINSG